MPTQAATYPPAAATHADPAGDNPYGADLTAVGFAYRGGAISLSARANGSNDPTGAAWKAGDLGIVWSLDTNGDGVDDWDVSYGNDGNRVVAEVSAASTDAVVCTATADYEFTSYALYRVRFRAPCIGSPEAFAVSAAMVEVAGSTAYVDLAPDAGWGFEVHRQAAHTGYWMLGTDGKVYSFGDAPSLGGITVKVAEELVDLEPNPTGDGYWLLQSGGGIFAFGAAKPFGSVEPAKLSAGERAASLSATPTGRGYWIFTTKGRVFAFGDATSYGDMSGTTLNGPVLDSITTPTGNGYYMVASDGGIFAFGDATFRGSMGGTKLNAPVQSLVPDPNGVGYWLVASDGGVFAFEAGFRGSMGSSRLNKPITGMVPYGNGYLMVGEDGGIFSFSDKGFAGSLGATPPANPIASVAVLDES